MRVVRSRSKPRIWHIYERSDLDSQLKIVQVCGNEGIDEDLLAEDKEMQFLERITQLSKSFLKDKSEKD